MSSGLSFTFNSDAGWPNALAADVDPAFVAHELATAQHLPSLSSPRLGWRFAKITGVVIFRPLAQTKFQLPGNPGVGHALGRAARRFPRRSNGLSKTSGQPQPAMSR